MAENAPSLFSTSHASTTGKSKRHSLNIISPGPRPLQLASGSVLSSPSRSPAALNHSTSADSPPGSLSSFGATSSGKVKNGRRQSSISYLPSGRDKDRRMSLVSPLSPTGFSRGMISRNGSSAAAGNAGIDREMEQNSRTSMDALKQLKGRPVTLTEKHAELLHFIAQKESKCLELRSQLASHEAELLQLKRKWERIVNRGFERTSSSSLPSPTTPYTPSSIAINGNSSSSGVVLEGIKEGVQGMGRFITAGLGSIAHVGVAEDNTPAPSSSTTTNKLSPTSSRGNRRLSSKFPVPLRLKSEGRSNYEHESHSSSSTSASFTTLASSSTSATSLMLEQGTTTPPPPQVLSPPFTSTSDEAEAPNDYDEFGDFEEAPAAQSLNERVEQEEENPEQVLMVHDTGATPTMSPNPHFQRRDRVEEVEQKDLGASDMPGLDFSWDDDDGDDDDKCRTTAGTSTTAVDRTMINDFIMNPGSQKDNTSSFSISSSHTVQQPYPTEKPPPKKIKTPSLPGVSSIPGLALSSMSTNGAAPQSMSTWVESVGKKWGEIRESQTFTKNQKRASILLSDVSQSIVSALISPTPLSASPRSGTPSSKSPSLDNPFTMNNNNNAFHTPSHGADSTTLTTNKNNNKNEIPITTSLLDDLLDIGEVDESLKLGMIGSPILVPDQTTTTTTKNNNSFDSRTTVTVPGIIPSSSSSNNSIDDEDWNW